MKRNVTLVGVSFLLVLLGIVGYQAINRAIAKNVIKASDTLVQREFRLTVSNEWSNKKERSFIDLVWDDISDSDYQVYRSEDGLSWDKMALDHEKVLKPSSDFSEVASSNSLKRREKFLENRAQDNTVNDDIAPESPRAELEYGEGDHFTVKLSSKDKGKEYQWYVLANTKKYGIQKSDIIKKEVTSELQGYIYVIDNSPNTVPVVERDSSGEIRNIDVRADLSEATTQVSGIAGENSNWMHVLAVDRANNVSDVKHINLKNNTKEAELKDVNRYVAFNVERTADTAKLIDIALGSSMEKKMKSLEIKIPKNTEIKEYDTLALPTSWYKFQNSDDEEYKSFTLAMNDNNDINTIKNFLESLRFTIKHPTHEKGRIQVIFHELVYTSWEAPDGKTHYYTFIPTQKTWLQAYNLAKKMKYRGLTGYLATLTSSAEHNFVYANIAKQSGWLGGGRLVKTNGQKINDEAVISEKITDYITTGVLSQQWYWVDGPEKGLVFFDKTTYKEGGKAPAGVYQGFNNPLNGGAGAEPNNSGGEYILEFAQASAGAPTKLWNDLTYNRTSYNTGYYIEFSEYGSQKEKEEETDVLGSSEIPQKVSVKAFDDQNNRLVSGDFMFDQQLRIGKKEIIDPKNIDMYDFIKLTDLTDNQISPLEYTIGNTFQEGKLIYSSRKLTVHVRQVIMNKNDQIIFPKKGYGVLESRSQLGGKKDEVSLSMVSTSDNTALFDSYVIRYQITEPLYTFVSKIPMNYELIGYVLTTEKQQHLPELSSKSPVQVDVSMNPEIWLTTYIRPSIEQPSLYHWEYETNKLGEIKMK